MEFTEFVEHLKEVFKTHALRVHVEDVKANTSASGYIKLKPQTPSTAINPLVELLKKKAIACQVESESHKLNVLPDQTHLKINFQRLVKKSLVTGKERGHKGKPSTYKLKD